MKAIGYMRKSVVHLSEGKSGEVSAGIQEAAIRGLAEQEKVDDLTILSDWGVSGSRKMERRRVGWLELLGAVETGGVDLILAYDISRLSRSAITLLHFYELCKEKGVRVVTQKDGQLDFSSPAGNFVLTMMAGASQFQSAQGVDRSREGVASRRAQGLKLGEAFYGDDPLHPEHDWVKVVAAYRAAGSFERAARSLNEAGVPAHRGGQWHGRTVGLVVRHREKGLAEKTIKRGSRIVAGHRFGGLVRCPCGGRMRGAAKASRPGYISYACYRASTLPDHPRPATMAERFLMTLWTIESTRMLPMVDGVVVGEALEAAKARKSRLVGLYGRNTISVEDLEREYAAVAAEIEELERLDNPRTRAVAAEDLIALNDLVEDPAAFNAHLRRLWDHVECFYLGGKLLPHHAVWQAGVPLGPPSAGLVARLARDAGVADWLKAAGWLE